MNSFKEMYKKLTYIILSGMIFFLMTNVILLLSLSNKYTLDFFEKETKIISKDLKLTIDSLKKASKDVAHNEEIVSILEKNKTSKDISSEDKKLMFSEISLSEGFLHNLSFADAINVVSLDGEYLFSNKELHDDFSIYDRPWFKESMLENKYSSTLVPIHKDFTTGKYTTSIVSFILNKSNDVIGVTILDIYIDALLKNIESKYHLGEVYAHLITEDGYYPPINNTYNAEDSTYLKKLSNSKYYTAEIEGIKLYFDKFSSTYIETSIKSLGYSIYVYVVAFVLTMALILYYTKKLFKPIVSSLNQFKGLLKSNNNDISTFSKKGELEQLELLSNMLSKSFDDKVNHLIYYDDFTNLPNKKSLIKITNDLIKIKDSFALIFIDISNMKTIIELFGYSFADNVVKEFAAILSSSIDKNVVLTKYSHSKFIIIYPSYDSSVDLEDFYKENILDVFENRKLINNTTKLNLSASVSIYPEQGNTLDMLLIKNEFMIDISKRQSLYGTLLSFNDDIYKEICRIESIKLNLENAIKNNEFKILYQPIVNKNGDVTKLEALIRWQSSVLGNVSPVEFIKYAEETGYIIDIGYWIFEEVCKNYTKLSTISKDTIQVSINVSPIQLLDDSFSDNIANIITKYDINPNSICVEITESVLVETNDIIGQNLSKLSDIGVFIALDDFGTGYSSFAYLKQFDFNILKLDKVFIDEADDNDYNIIKSIKNIATELNMTVVAEGVETKDQFDNLCKIDLDYFQGYYFSKPLDLELLLKTYKIN